MTWQSDLLPSLVGLQVTADAIVPDGVVVVCRDTNGDVSQLFADEYLSVKCAVTRRQAEFAAGRTAARVALRKLGQPAISVPVGAGRAPIWPDGYTGSISHCQRAVVVAATRTGQNGYIGIDVEEAVPLEQELWDSICTPTELYWLGDNPQAGLWVKVIFSIKEAIYKAQHPLTGRLLDFQQVEIAALDQAGNFTAQVAVEPPLSVSGCFRIRDEFVLSLATAKIRTY